MQSTLPPPSFFFYIWYDMFYSSKATTAYRHTIHWYTIIWIITSSKVNLLWYYMIINIINGLVCSKILRRIAVQISFLCDHSHYSDYRKKRRSTLLGICKWSKATGRCFQPRWRQIFILNVEKFFPFLTTRRSQYKWDQAWHSFRVIGA